MTPFSLPNHWTRKLHVEFSIHICANVTEVNGCVCQKLEQVWFCFLQLLTHIETVHKHVSSTCTWNLLDTVQHLDLGYKKSYVPAKQCINKLFFLQFNYFILFLQQFICTSKYNKNKNKIITYIFTYIQSLQIVKK